MKKRYGFVLIGFLAICCVPVAAMAAGNGKGDCTQTKAQKQEQKRDGNCRTDLVIENTNIRLLSKNGPGNGDCDGDQDRDRSRDNLRDGSCQTDGVINGTATRLLSRNGGGDDNGDRDQIQDKKQDGSCTA